MNVIFAGAPVRLALPRRLYWSCPLLLLGFAAVLTGCGGNPGANVNSITGKVTLDGQVVGGTVTFVYDDKKSEDKMTPISPTGEYVITDPPPGNVKIVVKGMQTGAGPLVAPPTKDAPKMAELPGSSGVNPPAKYESAATTPLTYEVKKGKHKHDLTLTK